MTGTDQLEMRYHKLVDRIGKIEHQMEVVSKQLYQALAVIELLKDKLEEDKNVHS